MTAGRREQKQGGASLEVPHLSHSRINRYLHCPEQYRLYYVENLRPKVSAAGLVFGQILHQALAYLFRTRNDPVTLFTREWREAREIELRYSERESWERLSEIGDTLLEKFAREQLPRIGVIRGVERGFRLSIGSFTMPFVGVIDLLAELDSKMTVVDFKSAGSEYQEHTVALSDQLTAYQLAEPEADQVALCVLVKRRTPQIEWHRATRTPADLLEYLGKVEIVGRAITAGHFYKRPGWWCGSCDYLPACLGDRERVKDTLVRNST